VKSPQVVGGKIRSSGYGLFAFHRFFFVGVCIRNIKELVSTTPKMTLDRITAWRSSIFVFVVIFLLLFGLYFGDYASFTISMFKWYNGIH
jgi:hypothetical protein